MALAQCWETYKGRGLPPEIGRALLSLPTLFAIPEFKVDLPPKGGRPSQSDLLVIAYEAEGRVAITVEGKVDEPFGPTLQERRLETSPGVQERISYLLKILGLPSDIPGTIRYQLLHRTASAILAAKQFEAERAIMLVHSFSQERRWYEDFEAFVRLFGMEPEPETELPVAECEGIDLSLLWCQGEARFLKKLPS